MIGIEFKDDCTYTPHCICHETSGHCEAITHKAVFDTFKEDAPRNRKERRTKEAKARRKMSLTKHQKNLVRKIQDAYTYY